MPLKLFDGTWDKFQVRCPIPSHGQIPCDSHGHKPN